MKYTAISNDRRPDKAPGSKDKITNGPERGTEAHLDHLEDNSQAANEKEDLFREEKDEEPPAEKLSPLRRLALVASLLFCVFVIFAFAFLLPCHGAKCKGQGNCNSQSFPSKWTRNINIPSIEPTFIKVIGLQNELPKDIVLGYSVCQDSSKKGCFGGLIGFMGPSGEKLWNLTTNSTVTAIVCMHPHNSDRSVCFVSSNQSELYWVNIRNGELKWKVILSGRIMTFDMIGDSDVVVLQSAASGQSKKSLPEPGNEELTLVSGRSGKMIGSSILVSQGDVSSLLTTFGLANKTEFVLLCSHSPSLVTGSLLAISANDLYKKAKGTWNASYATKWGSLSPDPITGFIKVLNNTVIFQKPVLEDLNSDGIIDIVICGKDMKSEEVQVLALDGVNLQVLWKIVLPASSIDKPLVSSLFDGDDIPDIAVVLKQDNISSSFTILNGANGSSLWTMSINKELSVPPTGVAPSLSTSGGFLLWLPKSDLKIMQESSVNSKSNSEDKKNRKRRKSSQVKESELPQDLEIHENDAGLYSQGALNDISQFAKNSERAYKGDLEGALIYGVLERQQESEEMNEAVQRRESYSRELISHYQLGKGLAEELEELHESSDGRHKRVASQRVLRRQSLKAHQRLSQSRDESLRSVRGRVHDSLPAHQSQKSGLHGKPLPKELNSGKRESLIAVQRNSPTKENKSPVVSRQDLQHNTHAKTKKDLRDDSNLRSRHHVSQDPLEKSTQKPVVAQETLLPGSCSRKESSSADTLVAVFVHKPQNAPTELDKVLEESSFYLGAEKYKALFGTSPPGTQSCVKFVARVFHEPVLENLDGNRKLQLVYAVSYIEVIPPSAHVQSKRRIVQLKMAQV